MKWDIPNVFESATPGDLGAYIAESANSGQSDALRWTSRLAEVKRSGSRRALKEFLDDLTDAAAEVTQVISAVRRGNRIQWSYRYPSQAVLGDLFALAMLRLVDEDQLSRFNYCQSPACGTLFFGNTQRKWCSRNCGSRTRVKRMRSRRT